MHDDFIKFNQTFEQSIKQIQNDLRYLITENKASERFVQKQNLILKNLIEFQRFTHSYINHITNELGSVRIERREQIQQLREHILSLEAVCILHGIMDFPYWLSFSKKALIEKATKAQHEKEILLPLQWREYINSLPDGERKTIKQILYKAERKALKELLKELNQKRKSIYSKLENLPTEEKKELIALLIKRL